MANLPETDSFDAGIYQIETVDDVVGGVAGISNMQGKALANRTKHLNEHSLKDDTTPIGNYTIGDLFYAAGARLLAKLGIGANKRVLTSSGSAPQWSEALDLAGTIASAISLKGPVLLSGVEYIIADNAAALIKLSAEDGIYFIVGATGLVWWIGTMTPGAAPGGGNVINAAGVWNYFGAGGSNNLIGNYLGTPGNVGLQNKTGGPMTYRVYTLRYI